VAAEVIVGELQGINAKRGLFPWAAYVRVIANGRDEICDQRYRQWCRTRRGARLRPRLAKQLCRVDRVAYFEGGLAKLAITVRKTVFSPTARGCDTWTEAVEFPHPLFIPFVFQVGA
jgi:hypothetical protein